MQKILSSLLAGILFLFSGWRSQSKSAWSHFEDTHLEAIHAEGDVPATGNIVSTVCIQLLAAIRASRRIQMSYDRLRHFRR